MEVEVIVDAVKKMFEETEVVYDDIDWHEATKYLAVVMSKEEIKQEGLESRIPKRKTENRGRPIGVHYLSIKENDENWIKPAEQPGRLQKKRIIALVVANAVKWCSLLVQYFV